LTGKGHDEGWHVAPGGRRRGIEAVANTESERGLDGLIQEEVIQ